jgi:16S rRNA (guanine527-N7)-methyltransferase
MFPGLAVTLLDSLRKRTDFLEETVRSLGLREVTIVHGRAEDLGRDPCYREKYPLVVARAVAPLPVLAELCLPFAAVGGIFAAYKGPEGDRELAAAGGALELLGGGRTGKFFYNLPEGQGRRILLLIKKEKNTAEKYPRRAGKPQRSPLG